MTAAPAATATYKDTYAGDVAAVLVPFKTRRNGKTVVRFRWEEQVRGFAAGGWASPFMTVEGAVKAAQHHYLFSNIHAMQ